jgi:hypothetical protein
MRPSERFLIAAFAALVVFGLAMWLLQLHAAAGG